MDSGFGKDLWNFSLTNIIRRNKYTLPILVISLIINVLLLLTTWGTLQELVFILFGAPIIYASLVYGMFTGTLVAVFAGLAVILSRGYFFYWNPSHPNWIYSLAEGPFIPLFYLFFCLLIAKLILNERNLREEYCLLSEQLSLANQNNLKLFTSTIQALAAAIDAKDPYTRGHSDRVTRFANAIALELGFSTEEKRQLFYGAVLHDIGKIGVKGAILRKPGKLTPDEYQEIREHPGRGAAILGSIESLKPVIPLVYHHHEWYNGSGYPDGIAGEDIPLGARIIALADAYDAMTSDRPYREGLEQEQALSELCRCSGIQFDPHLTEIFCTLVEQKKVDNDHYHVR